MPFSNHEALENLFVRSLNSRFTCFYFLFENPVFQYEKILKGDVTAKRSNKNQINCYVIYDTVQLYTT